MEWYADFAKENHLPPVRISGIERHWGHTVPQIISNLWPQFNYTQAERLYQRFVPPREYLPKPFPGMLETMVKLIEEDYILVIISSGDPKAVRTSYQKHLHPNFGFHEVIVCGGERTYHKPDARVFDYPLLKLENIGIEASEVLYVGDHILDFLAAKNRKLTFVAVLTGITSREEFLQEGLSETSILDSFRQLPTFLRHS